MNTKKMSIILMLSIMVLCGCAHHNKASIENENSVSNSNGNISTNNTEVYYCDTVNECVDSSASAGAFKEAELIKIGKHTYYPEGLFNYNDRDRDYKDHMISQLTEADKDLHDDVFVHGIGESEVKGEFRFFGLMMNDGVIYDCAQMTCWYDDEQGNVWSNDSKFRRADFSKSGLIDAETAFGKVYENASKSDKVKRVSSKVTGTYLLMCDSEGKLYYRFTVNTYSTVDVDAKTGEIFSERYWDGIYT